MGVARAVRLPSRHLRDERGRRIGGLILLDPVPADTILPYPGVLVDEYQVKAISDELKISLSHAYAKGGVKSRGKRTVILGQACPTLCAHFVNCVFGTKLQSNARWDEMRVNDEFGELESLRMGEMYPGVRMTKDLEPGEELLLRTYGAGYWGRHLKEEKWNGKSTLKFDRLLTPQIQRILAKHDEEDLDRAVRRRGVKRLRE